MSYSIYIGEAVLDVPEGEDVEDLRDIGARVHKFEHPEAPRFPGDEMTGRSNGRHPGYGTWHDWCEQVGLYDLFFGSRDREAFMGKPACPATRDVSLMHDHPGCYLLTRGDLAEITEARKRWEAKPWPHAERIAGWDPNHKWSDPGPGDPRYDNALARLIWLEWWVTWALANCKVPAIHNN